jgi:hypothetical protein
MKTIDFDEVVELYHRAASEFVKGNPEPYKLVFSQREDVSLANPFGPVVHGWKQVAQTMERAASLYRDGEIMGFENVATYVTTDLAYIVEGERIRHIPNLSEHACLPAIAMCQGFFFKWRQPLEKS